MFVDILRGASERVEGIRSVFLVGSDGMVVARVGSGDRDTVELIAATYGDLLQRVTKTHLENDLSPIREWITGFEDGWIVLRSVSNSYSLLAWTQPEAILGQVRFEMRKASSLLLPELDG